MKYKIDGSDILIIQKKEYCILINNGKWVLVELPNLKLKQATIISDLHDIPISTVEQIQNSLENHENRKAGYFGLYQKTYESILECLKDD